MSQLSARLLGPEVALSWRIGAAVVGVSLSWLATIWWGVAVNNNPLDLGYAVTLLVIAVILVSPGAALMLAVHRRNALGLAAVLMPTALSLILLMVESDDSSTAGIGLLGAPVAVGLAVAGVLLLEGVVGSPKPPARSTSGNLS